MGYASHGRLLGYIGDIDRGIELIEKIIEIHPAHPNMFNVYQAEMYLLKDDIEKAFAIISKQTNLDFMVLCLQGAIYGLLDKTEEGKSIGKELIKVRPDFTLSKFEKVLDQYCPQKLKDYYIRGLGRCELPKK